MLKIKDLNHKLADYLDYNDILRLSLINKKSYNTFDDKYWKRKFYNEYNFNFEINIYNESWKFYYILITKWLKCVDHVASLKFAIREDRCDLLKMIYFINKYDKDKLIFDWSGKHINFTSTIYEIIEEDSLSCFDFIYDENKHYTSILLNKIITEHSHKILFYLQNYIKNNHAMLIIENNCLECFGNLIIEKYTNYDFIKRITLDNINKEYCETFHNFIKNVKDINIIKDKALEENRFDLLKAIAKYTSKFSIFYKGN